MSARQRGLFGGYEPEPRDPRGRKRKTWAKQTAEKVVLLAAQEKSQEVIAAEVGLSVKTLIRIYADELQKAEGLLRTAVFEAQVRRATESGSTPAARFVIAELDKQRATAALRERERKPGQRIEPIGKKEERQQAAASVAAAGGKFAPPPAPKLIN